MVKGKRSSVSAAHSRQLKLSSNINDKAERDASSFPPIKVSNTNQVNQVNRERPRRKMEKPKPMAQQDPIVSGNIFRGQQDKSIASLWNGSSHKVNFLSFAFYGIF